MYHKKDTPSFGDMSWVDATWGRDERKFNRAIDSWVK